MTLKEIQQIKESLVDLYDFASGNCDGDESGIYQYMGEHTSKSISIVEKQIELNLEETKSLRRKGEDYDFLLSERKVFESRRQCFVQFIVDLECL